MKNYPRIHGHRRKPNPVKDGNANHGKPCVICGQYTIGEKWVQWSYMRGEDDTLRVCAQHWDESDETIIEEMFNLAG